MHRRQPHKFRFQLLHAWLTATHPPCKAADVGGGKGLLAHLLNQSGWDVTVIDPFPQLLHFKYKDVATGRQIKLTQAQMASVPRMSAPFQPHMAAGFDLLIGLHAHGSNMAVIQAAAQHHTDFALLPCCVIDEPIEKRPGVNWFNSLQEYAQGLSMPVKTVQLDFVGKNRVLYTTSRPQPDNPPSFL